MWLLSNSGWTLMFCILCWPDWNFSALPVELFKVIIIQCTPLFKTSISRVEMLLYGHITRRWIWVFPWLWQAEEKTSRTASGLTFLIQIKLYFFIPQKWPRPGSKSLTQFVAGNTDLVCLEVIQTLYYMKHRVIFFHLKVSDCRENIEAVHYITSHCTRYLYKSHNF